MATADIGRKVLFRRRALGLSRERLAAAVGVTAERLGRWERREEFPTSAQARILARVLAFDADSLTGGSAVPERPVVVAGNGNGNGQMAADPWGHLRTGNGNGNGNGSGDRFGLNRDALIGKQSRNRKTPSNGANGKGSNGNGNGRSPHRIPRAVEDVALPDAPAFVPMPPVPTTPPPGNGNGGVSAPQNGNGSLSLLGGTLERELRRRATKDERRLAKEMETARRLARERALRDAQRRLRLDERSERRRVAAPKPGRPKRPMDGGSVFPLPAKPLGDQVVARPVPYTEDPRERSTYLRRTVTTAAAAVGLMLALWWAIGAVDEVAGVIADLFSTSRGTGDPNAFLQGITMLG